MPAQNEIPLLIQLQDDLDAVVDQLRPHTQVAVDTEFVRVNTYAPQLGLLQLSAGGLTVCVDPLAGLDMQPLWQLLFDPQRTIVMHSGKQDMEVMWFDQGEIIHNLVDTQVCAGLLGYPAQIGYAGLLQELLNIEIGKTQTRTDWSRRPLTEAQLHYAAEDVVHLPEMLAILRERLEQLGRWEWALEDSRAICDVSLYRPVPENAWQRLKSLPFLPPAQQARARALATWREARAVNSDKPRGWIISDKALLQLAAENPQQERELGHIEDLPPAVARKQGRKLMAILADATAALERGDTSYQQEFPNPEKEKAQVKKCSRIIRAKAEELNIAPEVLGSKKDIQNLLKDNGDARLSGGWRRDVLGDQLRDAVL